MVRQVLDERAAVLPRGRAYTTAQLNLRMVRPVFAPTRAILTPSNRSPEHSAS
ncbi:hypothetical protein [Streptomyces violaceusniger]|uniref:Uncharacterized protein n=1 Tax=Streptomyces violaceusniger (strain Tu 4113) TaxID=653045 RepID=G2PG02_STRV4|nr:hypothetical protein [Streptomyces violaceusniger]AEM85157.1 hypothetical protein Strvi_5644 [Streptomyces violaceusniger Tu 4113]